MKFIFHYCSIEAINLILGDLDFQFLGESNLIEKQSTDIKVGRKARQKAQNKISMLGR